MGNLHANKAQFKAIVEGNELNLSQKEFEVLWLLTSHPTETFSSEDIIETIMECGMMIHEKKFIELMTANVYGKAGVPSIHRNQSGGYSQRNKYMF